MNSALAQSDPEQQRSNKSSSCSNNSTTSTTATSNYVNSHNKLKNAINTNDTTPFITTTHTNAPSNPTSTTMATMVMSTQQRGHGIYGHHSLSGSLSKIASSSRDYLYPVGTHGSLSTSYDAFFTDDGYNEAEQQGGILAAPYTNGPVEFEDSRFYEGRYEDGVHDEYDYDASSSSDSQGHGQYHQQQQQQQQQQQLQHEQHQQQQHLRLQLRFSEEPMATEPALLTGTYRRLRQQSNNMQPIKRSSGLGSTAHLTASALLSPLRYRDMEESTFDIRNEGDKEAYRCNLPSQSQLFQPEFTAGMNGAGYLEDSIMEDNNSNRHVVDGDGDDGDDGDDGGDDNDDGDDGGDDDGAVREESGKKHNSSWRQQSVAEHEMGQDDQPLQDSGAEDDSENDEGEDDEEEEEEGENVGCGENDNGEDDDEDDEGGPGGTAKGRKKTGRPTTSQKTIPKAMMSVPSIQKQQNSQHSQHTQSDQMQHQHHRRSPHQHQSMPQQSSYQTQQLHQQQRQQQHYQQQHQHQHSTSSLSLPTSKSSTSSTSSYHSSNFITEQQFLLLAEDYLLSLSPKKREKALLSNSMYQKVLMVLIQPKNTQVSTAQFRFWAKKMFTLSTTPTHYVVCHGGKPVATRECLYDVLVYCHRKSSHGGWDKTSAEVRQHYSWVPKELIARFVKHCPLCLSRRSTQQRQNGGPVAASNCGGGPTGSLSLDIDDAIPSFFESHGHDQRFESNPPPLHGSAVTAVHMSNGGPGDEDKGNCNEDSGDAEVDQGGLSDMHHRFAGGGGGGAGGGSGHRGVHLAQQQQQQQPTFASQPHGGEYGHQHQQHHATSSSMQQRSGFDALQSPNSPIGNAHEGSQPWAWRETGHGVAVDPKDGAIVDRQQEQQQHAGDVGQSRALSTAMTTHHNDNSNALQAFSQSHDDDDNNDGIHVDRDYGQNYEDDENENNDIHGEVGGHTTMDSTHSSTTVATAYSDLYHSNKVNNQDSPASSLDKNDEDSNGGNSPSGMVGISQDLDQYDGHQYRDPAFLHHQHHHQQQERFFQQNHHRHQHQHPGGLGRHHPYQQQQHRHTHDNAGSGTNREAIQAVAAVHPNGHILHDRHPIHNRARIMALANSAASASASASASATATGCAGDPAGGAPGIPQIHAIHQAALILSQQYRYHHHYQQQHHNHHQFASNSHFSGQNPPYLHHHHGHHLQQHPQQQQQHSYRQIMAQHHHRHPGVVVSGHPSAFMYTFTNPDGGVDNEDDDISGHEEGSEEEGLEDDHGDEQGHDSDDDGDEAEVDEDRVDAEGRLLLLSESGVVAVSGQASQMTD